MSTEVKVDLSVLETALSTYDKQILELENAHQEITNALSTLRISAWKSNGADAFFANYDQKWNRDFKDHIEYLKHLRDCLKLAYDGFNEEYNKKIF